MRNDDFTAMDACPWPANRIFSLAHKLRSGTWSLQSQRHARCELIYVDYGGVMLQVDGRDYHLHTGDCFIIASDAEHWFKGIEGKPFDFLNLTFEGHLPEDLTGTVLHLVADERNIVYAIKEGCADETLTGRQLTLLQTNELLLRIAMRLDQGRTVPEPVLGENRLNYRRQVVQGALDYLRDHLADPLDPEAIAAAVGLSGSHLRALIRQETGRNLRWHLMTIRLDAACHLLRGSSENIEAISWRVGYHSVPHFCTVFKKRMGMTPSQYACSLL